MLRKSTDFAGWQSEIEYLADEAERQNKIEASIALYQREAKVPYRRARLWQFGILCFIGSLLFAWYVLLPLLWTISQWIEE